MPLLVILSSATAWARVDLMPVRPSPRSIDHLGLVAPRALEPGRWSLVSGLDLAANPLVFVGDDGSVTREVISRRVTGWVGAAVGLGRGLDLGLVVPGVVHQTAEPLRPGGPGPDSSALGDLLATIHWQLPGPGRHLGAFGAATLPTGARESYAGQGDPQWELGLSGGLGIGPVRLLGALSARYRADVEVANLQVGPALAFRGGAMARLPGPWMASVAVGGETSLTEPLQRGSDSPVELVGGVRRALPGELWLSLAAGRGLTRGYGTSSWRAIASLGWGPGPFEATKDERPVQTTVSERDRDGDGIPDVDDEAPWHPEDHDGFADLDGVPDLDDDLDGIPDARDPEPTVPRKPAHRAGKARSKAKGTVLATDVEIRIPDTVRFYFGKTTYTPETAKVLDEVVDVIQRNPQIRRIRVEGHADSVGSREYNMRLSIRRAQVVRDHLVKMGVPPERIVIRGYGEERPARPNTLRAARAQNRRVEFILEETEEGTSEAAGLDETAVLVWANGEIKADGEDLVPDTAIVVGSMVSTGPGGRAVLRFPDLSVLVLGPGARIRLGKAYWDSKQKISYVSAKVYRGSATWTSSPIAQGKSRASLYTRTVTVDFDMGQVRVTALAGDATRVETLVGVARVSSGGAGLDLMEGQGVTVAAHAPPGEPVELPPRPKALGFMDPETRQVSWGPAPEGLGYHVEVSPDTSFVKLVWRSPLTRNTWVEIPTDVPTDAVWRVCPSDPRGFEGRCSPIWPLTLGQGMGHQPLSDQAGPGGEGSTKAPGGGEPSALQGDPKGPGEVHESGSRGESPGRTHSPGPAPAGEAAFEPAGSGEPDDRAESPDPVPDGTAPEQSAPPRDTGTPQDPDELVE